jgi:hypothetical protein
MAEAIKGDRLLLPRQDVASKKTIRSKGTAWVSVGIRLSVDGLEASVSRGARRSHRVTTDNGVEVRHDSTELGQSSRYMRISRRREQSRRWRQ